jgi:hypothetical protein
MNTTTPAASKERQPAPWHQPSHISMLERKLLFDPGRLQHHEKHLICHFRAELSGRRVPFAPGSELSVRRLESSASSLRGLRHTGATRVAQRRSGVPATAIQHQRTRDTGSRGKLTHYSSRQKTQYALWISSRLLSSALYAIQWSNSRLPGAYFSTTSSTYCLSCSSSRRVWQSIWVP